MEKFGHLYAKYSKYITAFVTFSFQRYMSYTVTEGRLEFMMLLNVSDYLNYIKILCLIHYFNSYEIYNCFTCKQKHIFYLVEFPNLGNLI